MTRVGLRDWARAEKGTDDLGLDGFAPGEHHLSIVKVPEVS